MTLAPYEIQSQKGNRERLPWLPVPRWWLRSPSRTHTTSPHPLPPHRSSRRPTSRWWTGPQGGRWFCKESVWQSRTQDVFIYQCCTCDFQIAKKIPGFYLNFYLCDFFSLALSITMKYIMTDTQRYSLIHELCKDNQLKKLITWAYIVKILNTRASQDGYVFFKSE